MNATRIYAADIRKLPPTWQDALPYIAPSYQERAIGRKPEDSRRAEFLAGLLLSQIMGVVMDEQLMFGPAGKPALVSGYPSFNLSHGGDFVVLAVSEDDVGIDVERVPVELGARERLAAQRICTLDELDTIEQVGNAAPRTFALRWTGKEAILKARGCGFEVDPRACPEVFDGWIVKYIEHDGHMIAIAQSDSFALDLVVVDVEALVKKAVEGSAIGEEAVL